MMQIAMGFGFLTSYPVNWWLIKHGVKEFDVTWAGYRRHLKAPRPQP